MPKKNKTSFDLLGNAFSPRRGRRRKGKTIIDLAPSLNDNGRRRGKKSVFDIFTPSRRRKGGFFDGSLSGKGRRSSRRGIQGVFDRTAKAGDTLSGGLGKSFTRGQRLGSGSTGMARQLQRTISRKMTPTERAYYDDLIQEEIEADTFLSAYQREENLIAGDRGNFVQRLVRRIRNRTGWFNINFKK